MRKTVIKYGFLSFLSFCFFSAIFHTVVNAQVPENHYLVPTISEQQPSPTAKFIQISIAPITTPSLSPTTLPPKDNQATPGAKSIESTKTPTQEPSPTTTTTPTPTSIPTITITPTSIPTATPTLQVTPTSQTITGGLNAETLFSMTNAHRQSIGLSALQKDDRLCQLAASRAPEIENEIVSGTMHSGLRARNLPYWNTENIISMNSEAAAFNWWLNDKIHRDAIQGNYTYSCVACFGNSCAQEFSNFQPK
jgi:uncharacterized protein YkwD